MCATMPGIFLFKNFTVDHVHVFCVCFMYPCVQAPTEVRGGVFPELGAAQCEPGLLEEQCG